MAKKWSNENLAGALHYVTGIARNRKRIFKLESAAIAFYEELQHLRKDTGAKLVAHVLMPDHFHLIVNPHDGDIKGWTGALKSLTAKRITKEYPDGYFRINETENQVWQDSFKDLALWSDWMIWQKINYIHNNPIKAGLVRSARDYQWSSFRNFYRLDDNPLLTVDREWWFEDDVRRLSEAMDVRSKNMLEKINGTREKS